MADRARHAFGALENIDAALQANKIDAFDILFVKDSEGKPYVGWIDKDGNKVIVSDNEEITALETELATKANAEEIKAELDLKANAEEVNATIATIASDVVATAKAYTDTQIEEAVSNAIEIVEF